MYLSPENVRLRVSLEDVVGAPADGPQRVVHLVQAGDLLPELGRSPRQHRDGERHGKPKLDVISGVVVPSDQVHLQSSDHSHIFLARTTHRGYDQRFLYVTVNVSQNVTTDEREGERD